MKILFFVLRLFKTCYNGLLCLLVALSYLHMDIFHKLHTKTHLSYLQRNSYVRETKGLFVFPSTISIQLLYLCDPSKWSIQILGAVRFSIQMSHLNESFTWILCLFLYFYFHPDMFNKQITNIPMFWINHMLNIKFSYTNFYYLV